jgi:hypothetical protein
VTEPTYKRSKHVVDTTFTGERVFGGEASMCTERDVLTNHDLVRGEAWIIKCSYGKKIYSRRMNPEKAIPSRLCCNSVLAGGTDGMQERGSLPGTVR